MYRLLACLAVGLGIAIGLLGLRQQALTRGYEVNIAHARLQRAQLTLWDQQLRIARRTLPPPITTPITTPGVPARTGNLVTESP